MNMEKFTERSRGFLQAAQTIAMRESHQALKPEHLLKALLDDEEGFAANLISNAGGDAKVVMATNEAAVNKIPKVSGDSGQTYLDQQTAKVLDEAEKLAKKAGDSFVPVERMLTALAITSSAWVRSRCMTARRFTSSWKMRACSASSRAARAE